MNIDEKRKNRYLDKLSYFESSLNKFNEWLEEAKRNEMALMACQKVFQETIEALTDVIAMLVKDLGNGVKDDYSNIEIIKEKKIINEEEANVLKEANGLRNVLIHKYNAIDIEKFFESSKVFKDKLREIVNKIKSFVIKC